MIRDYNYRCKDRSILTPFLKRYLVEPLIVWVPKSIPANIITIFSNMLVYLSLALALIYGNEFKWNFILIPIALVIYVIGDHLDGLQAKRTNTSSALGEFCDHFLDTFNNGLVLVILFVLFQVENTYLIIYLLTTSYLAHASIFFHQFKTGWLVFEKYGSLEAMALIIGLLAISFFPSVYQFLINEVAGFKIIEYMLLFSSLGTLGTFVKSIIDAHGISARFLLFTILLIALASFLVFTNNQYIIFAFLILYPSIYIGAVMHGHLVDGKEPFPDMLSILALLFIVLLKLDASYLIYLIYFLILSVVYIMSRTFYPLRKHWVWMNPKLD